MGSPEKEDQQGEKTKRQKKEGEIEGGKKRDAFILSNWLI